MVYVVTVLKGKLYLLANLQVAKVCDYAEAADDLGDDLWLASDHIIASAATPMDFNRVVPLEVTQRLMFVSGGNSKPLQFQSPGYLDQQTLRGVRELTPQSALALDQLLPPLKTILPDDLPVPLEKEEEAIRRTVIRSELDRDLRVVATIKGFYDNTCQVCQVQLLAPKEKGGSLRPFSDVHHLHARSEGGPDRQANGICVCPNCHAQFQRGTLAVRADFTIAAAYPGHPLEGRKVTVDPRHGLDLKYLRYHWEHVFVPQEGDVFAKPGPKATPPRRQIIKVRP
jgi:5-methylcytosine-specific restriction endonuclease McrA